MGYIYKITNQINGKAYVGKTQRTVMARWKEHCRHMYSLQHLPLYKALYKYGVENFLIETIEECDDINLDNREIYWINYYQTYGKNGYNCTAGSEGGIKTFPEEIEIIKNRYLAGERLDLLCKEFHHDYYPIKRELENLGVKINTNAGPSKLAKGVIQINPVNNEIVAIYNSISEASRAICGPGKNVKAIINHISKYKNTNTISHGFLWKTIDKGE